MLALSQLSYGPGSGGRLARVIPKREGHFSFEGWFFRVSFSSAPRRRGARSNGPGAAG
jgi:hypothetical protein